jgi:L-ascorbate metabolism protein UlaG (beta-lactamase superfamily)
VLPYAKNAPVEGVDIVAVTHEHPDHNYVELATGNPTVLRGLAGDGYAKIDQTVKGVRIRTVASYHDLKQGAERGKNAIFVFEMPGLKLVHLGDLGHPSTRSKCGHRAGGAAMVRRAYDRPKRRLR